MPSPGRTLGALTPTGAKWVECTAILVGLGCALDSRYGSPVYDVFRAGDRRGACRGKERDQVRHFLWLCWPPDGNPPERVHDDVAGAFIVGAVLACDFLDKTNRAIRFDPAG